ncbi:MAG: NADH-ubiquinone oxidoreductase chain J, partial [uncultured Friedmanniella sp.]
ARARRRPRGHLDRRSGHLLGPGPARARRCADDGAVAQRGARRAVPGRRDALARRALRRAGRPVPGRRAGDRLHRRHPHAVPVRPHAGRRRLQRLAHRDPARSARRRPGGRPRLRRPAHGSDRRRGGAERRHRGGGRARGGERRGQRRRHRPAAVHRLPVRLRDHERAAHHGGARGDGVGPQPRPDTVRRGRGDHPAGGLRLL